MSLLMKALEKAAKDREETGTERPVPAAAGTGAVAPGAGKTAAELSLEPIAPQPAAIPGRDSTSIPRRPAAGTPPAAQSAQAAAFIRAGQRPAVRGGVGAYAREHPRIVFGALVALFLAVYGTYMYVQIAHPGLFVKQQPRLAQSTPRPLTQAPPSAASESTAATAQPPIPLVSLLPPLQEGAENEKPLLLPPPIVAAPAAGTTEKAPAKAPAVPAPAARVPPSEPIAPRDTIKVTAGAGLPAIHPTLAEAYQSLNAGDLDTSQGLYNQLLRGDPNHVDALLGLAAIATQQSDNAQASKHYVRVLEVDPRNTLAQAGLIAIMGRADPLAAETRLKQLIASEPSAYLYFTLGNVYSDQDRWPDAQQAYFQAYHLQPNNPDYAYNLAVGLEHVGQPRLALNYYRGALELAASGRANFSATAAQERISKLEKAVQ